MTRRVLGVLVSILITATFLTPTAHAAEWVPKVPPLTTPWTSQVSPTNALPEYPRPQLARTDWQNLNGVWEFAGAPNLTPRPSATRWPRAILVPFPVESALSGIMRHEDYMFYRRTFTVPVRLERPQRVQLQLRRGGLAGHGLGQRHARSATHTGGYDAFAFDVTDALASAARNEIIVGVASPDRQRSDIPVGKQRRNPSGIFYTAASGIWQTVWLEPVRGSQHHARSTPPRTSAASALDLVVHGGDGTGQSGHRRGASGGRRWSARRPARPAPRSRVPVPNARAVVAGRPVPLRPAGDAASAAASVDTVEQLLRHARRSARRWSTACMRPDAQRQVRLPARHARPGLLAGRPLHRADRRGAALRPREARRTSASTWSASTSRSSRRAGTTTPTSSACWSGRTCRPCRPGATTASRHRHGQVRAELRAMVDQHKGVTSIVGWVPFNEGWGEYDAGRDRRPGQALEDPTRLVNHNSRVQLLRLRSATPATATSSTTTTTSVPAITRRRTPTRVAMLGEYGGLGLRVAGPRVPAGRTDSPTSALIRTSSR